ncbi:hypothetical protein NADE_000111 [Nannochloris sp. 'desiccata']|nr:hypothetical protein KSW81_005096 [Chlorella desiccata (nom. nud.)]KAH7617908.1 hypothetical protein NADE_000111 [Chlorella desiccata (nom. nud.)]
MVEHRELQPTQAPKNSNSAWLAPSRLCLEETDVVCDSLIPGVDDAGTIAILIAIGFVVGSILTALIFLIRQRKARQVDHEFRERFGSPLAAVVGNGTGTATSQQQHDVSLLLHAAAAPAYPEPMNTLYIPQKPPLLPKTMDTLSKAGPLGYSITSLRDSLCFSEEHRTQDNQTEGPRESAVFIPAYFGAAQSSSDTPSSGSGAHINNTRSTIVGAASGLDASATVIIREEGPPNASNVFRSPFAQRKESAQENNEIGKVEQVAPPPVFISPSKGLSNIGPLARSVSNLQIPSTVKSCANEIASTTNATNNSGPEVLIAVDPGVEEKTEDDITKASTIAEEYENPFATTSAAKAAHKHALLELEAAAKQPGLFLSTKAACADGQGTNAALPEVANSSSKARSGNYSKPGTKVTPKRSMDGIEEVAQVLEKRLDTATLATASNLNSSVCDGGGDADGRIIPHEQGEKDNNNNNIVHVEGSLRKSTMSDRSATPCKEKAE